MKTPEAFMLVVEYCERQGWIPVGRQEFHIQDWFVEMNGTNIEHAAIPPFHARVTNNNYIGILLMSPQGGISGGFRHTEAEFCEAMKAEITAKAGQEQ